ncbi:cytochrome C assembly protein [Ammoniphilus oxalaticus]|uniref:Cytochrome C assembly protein n=1 Tax=Ammoniphilus oxalaticus TaxID=66863 RepID=A0A419SKY9_9BACL|nr:cytochrome c biogenesis protein CcsA [Ammoniphilus oxalaticus]RKD24655.1 cytochrome C assembly protein [Ammoniphilus oxalaticus]
MYDVTIYLYAISVLMYFSDFLQSNQKVNKMAFWLLAIVWVFQSIFFVLQFISKDYFPVLTLFETLFFYSWILVTLSLVINHFFRMDLLIFFTNVLGFSVMSVTVFTNPTATPALSQQLISELLFIHISLALLSYAALSFAFILSVMYMIQVKLLKEKRWTPLLRKMPSLGLLDIYAYRLTMIGVPLLFLSLILGGLWAHIVGQTIWLDPKVFFSILVVVAYSVYLYRRVNYGWQGKKLAMMNVLAFVFVLLNFFISGSLSSFHQWLR